ncbi:MAG: class I SAM-dependent methyltransferase [bacterium]
MKQKAQKIALESCPLCGHNVFHRFLQTSDYFLTQEDFSLDRCDRCSLVFTNPVPAVEGLSAYYDSPEYLSHTSHQKSLYGLLYRFLRKINLHKKYQMISGFKPGGSALDIGQGTGEFLQYLKEKGWKVTGIEPNAKARNFARQHYQIESFGEEKLNDLPTNGFDLITMWHVLEHVVDLQARMKEIKRLIHGKGILIIAVPNLASPDFKIYGEKWAALDVPRHLYHFTPESMQFLLRKFNFKLISSFPLTMDAYYVSLLSEKYRGNAFPYLKAFLNGFRSNQKASRENNHSSMVFVAQPE